MSDYFLHFIERETGKIFRGKKIIPNVYSVVINEDPFTTEKFTLSELKKRFKSAKGNHSISKKKAYSRPRMYSAKTMTKEFRDYLNSSEILVKENAS